MTKTKVLVICGRNQKRSLTAEIIFKHHPSLSVRSAGVSRSARHVVSNTDVAWADEIWCMEDTHLSKLRHLFPDLQQPTKVLDIPDDYELMDEELVNILQLQVT